MENQKKECPLCGRTTSEPSGVDGLRRCLADGTIFGTANLTAVRTVISGKWSDKGFDNARYVDVVGVDQFCNPRRFHGWVDEAGNWIQIG